MRPEVRKLLEFVVEAKPSHFTAENLYYEPGDEEAPFFSEGFLYPLLGKEDARTLRALLKRALMALGEDERELLEVM